MLERGARLAAVLGLVAGVAHPAAAQAPEPVSFEEAVRTAIERNPDAAEAEAAIRRAEALLGQARAFVLPTVSISATESVIDSQREASGIVVAPRDQFVISGLVSVPVLAASGWAARGQAAERVEVTEIGAADVRRRVAVAAAQAYLAVIAAHRQVEVDERARDNAQAQLEYADTRLAGGAGSRLNMLRAAETLATNEVLVERSRLLLRLAQEALGRLMAVDRPMDAAAEPVFDVPPGASTDVSARTDVRFAVAQRDLAERVVDDSWKDWVPTIDATFVPQYVTPAGAFEEQDSWRAAIGLRFPLYLGGERRANRYQRQADRDAAVARLSSTELEARTEVRAARAAIEAAERAARSARLASDHGNEVLRITEIAFRAGATTNIELIDAQRRARDTETAVATAEDILRQARLELLVALGLFPAP